MFAVEARVPEMTKESQAFFILSPFTTWTDSRAAGVFVLGPEAAMLVGQRRKSSSWGLQRSSLTSGDLFQGKLESAVCNVRFAAPVSGRNAPGRREMFF